MSRLGRPGIAHYLQPAAVVDDPAELSVEAGMRYHLTTHGTQQTAMSSSADVRAAVSIGFRYADLTFAFCKILTVAEGDGCAPRPSTRPTYRPTHVDSSSMNSRFDRQHRTSDHVRPGNSFPA